jgi:hypothetical protein
VDVYVVPSEGGEPKRLTWHGAADVVKGWTPDGAKIVFASNRETNGPNAAPRFYTIPAAKRVDRALKEPPSPTWGKRVKPLLHNQVANLRIYHPFTTCVSAEYASSIATSHAK